MNERIRELVEKSGLFYLSSVPPSLIEKFAELIVKECTNMLPEDSVRDENGVHMYYVIREHFGVTPMRGEE